MTDEQSHEIQNEIDLTMDMIRENPLESETILKKLESIRDSIPCTCGNEDENGLPDVCPSCQKEVDWDWEMANFYDSQITNDATCPECGAEFVEIMQVVSWEKKGDLKK